MNQLAEITQNIIVDGNTINSFIYDNTLIPITSQWIWTKAVGTFKIWTGWATVEVPLFEVIKVITKWWLQVKWKTKEIEIKSSTVWGQFRILDYDFKIEQLPVEAVS